MSLSAQLEQATDGRHIAYRRALLADIVRHERSAYDFIVLNGASIGTVTETEQLDEVEAVDGAVLVAGHGSSLTRILELAERHLTATPLVRIIDVA